MSSEIIVSIPHTGTRFLRERLGVKDFIHTIAPWEEIAERIEGRKVISPLRSPRACWKSTARRKNVVNVAEFVGAWFTMQTVTLFTDVDFICIEQRRDSRIDDWAKVGQGDSGEFKHNGIDLKPIYDLAFVKPYYSIRDSR